MLLAQSPDHVLHYSGDFDLKGLQIAAYLMARYAERCHPWRFNPDAYQVALQSGGVPAGAHELDMLNTLPDVFAPVVAMIQETQTWAYQEGIVNLLAADTISSCGQTMKTGAPRQLST